MSSFSLGKSTTAVLKTVDKNVLYLDTKKATACKTSICKDIDNVVNDMENIHKLLNRCCKNNVVTGAYKTQIQGWSTKSAKQAGYAKSWKKNLNSKFDADTKEYTIKLLTDRIAELEKQIAALEKLHRGNF